MYPFGKAFKNKDKWWYICIIQLKIIREIFWQRIWNIFCILTLFIVNSTKLMWSLCGTTRINQINIHIYIIHIRIPQTLKFSSQLLSRHIVANSSHLSYCTKLIKHTMFNKRDTNGNRSQPLTTSPSRISETFVLQSLITKTSGRQMWNKLQIYSRDNINELTRSCKRIALREIIF